jgi:guanylate kinase
MDFYWLDRCDALLSLRGDSPGSDLEWERAGSQGKMRILGLDNFKYRLAEEGMIVCLVGPSGVGKTTLAREMVETIPSMSEAISHTSRPPRKGEVAGEDYHFVSLGEMERMKNNGDFLEFTTYAGSHYGFAEPEISGHFLQRNDVVAVVDKHGLEQIRGEYPGQVVGIHVVPPNLAALRDRMEQGGRSDLVIQQRLTGAVSEINDMDGWDYTVVNNDLDNTVQNLVAIYERERNERDIDLRINYLSAERRSPQERAS